MAELTIHQRVEDWAQAFRAKDINAIMSFYAPTVVSFDLGPPLRYAGADNKRRAWRQAFASFVGPVAYDVHELSVTTQGELAFVHSLNHIQGTTAGGRTVSLWLRWTACFRKLGGAWLVVHDHVSVPADVEHGRAVLELTP